MLPSSSCNHLVSYSLRIISSCPVIGIAPLESTKTVAVVQDSGDNPQFVVFRGEEELTCDAIPVKNPENTKVSIISSIGI